jgi:hypothetical protein
VDVQDQLLSKGFVQASLVNLSMDLSPTEAISLSSWASHKTLQSNQWFRLCSQKPAKPSSLTDDSLLYNRAATENIRRRQMTVDKYQATRSQHINANILKARLWLKCFEYSVRRL